ncbi:MAG: aldehyde dehydrogenase family protein [Phycisphaeraceae bacterium]|nr:aldehyde dehydrogenase family protein [Phycisphaeraceae bacterium]
MTTTSRLDVTKTYKLLIDGKFPRSESGRTLAVEGASGRVTSHVCHASRKDLRDAVGAARKALDPWRHATAYLRGQILYRMAEMMEGKREELAEAIRTGAACEPGSDVKAAKGAGGTRALANRKVSADDEVMLAIDRLVTFAGWTDKYQQVLGCNNPVAGPYYNFSVPEPTGVIAVVAPDAPALLGLVALLAPVICAGNTAVCVAGESGSARLAASVLGEVIATSDVPGGVVNILTGVRSELLPVIAQHRDIDGVHAANIDAASAKVLREGVAENLKRVKVREGVDFSDEAEGASPWWIEPFVEIKTVWHPSAM